MYNRFLKEQISGFSVLLDKVEVENISDSIYCRKYLAHLLENNSYYLEIYAGVLYKILSSSKKEISTLSLIDFGAGNGLLGLFAKYCGFGKIFIVDVDPKFMAAAENLSNQLRLNIDGFISGDIHAVADFLKSNVPDAIAGTDVIEHVYDLDDLFLSIRNMNPEMISVFTTASNPKNFLKVSSLRKLQRRDELVGGNPSDFQLFGEDPHESFLMIRKKIVKNSGVQLTNNEIEKLAIATRGLNQADILESVELYRSNGKMPTPPTHTNTCNPLNSSWTERILPLNEYQALYSRHGFLIKVDNGFYDEHKKGLKKILNTILNIAVRIFGISFSPFIIFVGTKK